MTKQEKLASAIVEAMGVQQESKTTPVMIECPECETIQAAIIEHTIPFGTYIHHCENCKYIIMESEWKEVKPFAAPAKAVEAMDSLPAQKLKELNSYLLGGLDIRVGSYQHKIIQDLVASNSNTDDTSLVSHSCTDCGSIEQVTTDRLVCELCPKCGLPGNPVFGPMCASDECYFKNNSNK